MKLFFARLALLVFLIPSISSAEEKVPTVIRVGVLASLSGFAANYGRAVLEGAELAREELRSRGISLELVIEDDGSQMKQTVTSYHRLREQKDLVALIGGTWWLESIVPLAERDGELLLSCETVFNDDSRKGSTYFILSGYLAPWVDAFRPLLPKENLRTALVIRSGSGFGRTLGRAMKELFSEQGRSFLGELEYSDLDAQDVRNLVLRVAQRNPDAVYIDAHPGGLANILRRLAEQRKTDLVVLTNAIGRDMNAQGLFNANQFSHFYFNDREAPTSEFREAFHALHKHQPQLNADLGYFAALLSEQLSRSENPVKALEEKEFVIHGRRFRFDANHVSSGPTQELWRLENGRELREER